MSFEMKFDGLKELDAKVKKLEIGMQRKVLRSAARKAANVVRKAARLKVPIGHGTLKKSIKVKTKRRGDGFEAFVHAGDKDAFHAIFIEYGTKRHSVLKGGKGEKKHPGATARPFMRPAFLETKFEQIDAMKKAITDFLAKNST